VIDDGVLVDGYYTDATLEVTVLSVESLRQTPSYSLLLRLLRHRVVGRVGLLLQHGSGASGTGDEHSGGGDMVVVPVGAVQSSSRAAPTSQKVYDAT
jgi:hypothetical protein